MFYNFWWKFIDEFFKKIKEKSVVFVNFKFYVISLEVEEGEDDIIEI